MNIAVLLKQVPDTTAKITVSDGKVDVEKVSKWSMSPYDEYALESGLQMKEATGGIVVAIACGPDRNKKMLTDSAAVGADTLIHIPLDGISDSVQIQNILAAVIKMNDIEVVLCGKQSADTNSGSTGPGIAEILNAACVTMVSEVSFVENKFISVRPSIAGSEKVSTNGISVFTFDKGISELRRPNVRGIMMAKKKVIETIKLEDLGIVESDSGRIILHSQNPPTEKEPGQIFEGVSEIPTIIAKLRNEANVI